LDRSKHTAGLGRGIGGSEPDVNLVQSIQIDLIRRVAEGGELSRNIKQIRSMGCSRYGLEIRAVGGFRRIMWCGCTTRVLERTPVEAEMKGWLKRGI